jgi:DNA-binding SARP family transcriptional activator/pimeloyl-ACP methyl ester carboxylesterase
VRISLLGPLRVDSGSGSVVLAAAKERALLSTLALNPGAVVATDALVRALWGDDPPASARKTLQTYISNLRQSLGADAIATDPAGYLLNVDVGDVDVSRFRALVRAGDRALRDGDAAAARTKLREALALWRGDPLTEAAPHTALAGEAVRLKEEYLSALETRIAADLAAGGHADLVAELEALVRDHPFRERLWGNLMVALYRCGRQADALATYQRARQRLVDELGLEPGGELRRTEEAILNQDPSLAAPFAGGGGVAAAAGSASGILRSPVRYTRSTGGVSVAYQVAGDGPIDILAVPGFVTHLDIWWNAPTDGLVRRLTSIGRLISFDKRGMGLSDRPESFDVMDWLDDALAVLDAVGADDVVVLGISAGTPTAVRLAALHKDRVRALVLFGGGPRSIAGPGYEIGHSAATLRSFAENLERKWGSGVAITSFAPSRANDPHVRDYWARYQQLSAAPAAAMRAYWTAVNDDVVDLLPKIAAPTLVLHPERDVVAPASWGRFMAERIPGAEFIALDSDIDLICVSDVIPDMAEEVAAFVVRALPEATAGGGGEPTLAAVVAVHTPSAALRDDIAAALARLGGRVQARPAVTAVFDAPGRALRCATALPRELRANDGSLPRFGVGVHVGECIPTGAGFRGATVDVAHRLAVRAEADGDVLVTATVRDVAPGGGFTLAPRPPVDDRPVFALAD